MKKKAFVRGATLLEAMISVVVLGFGSMALIRLELGSMKQVQWTRQQDIDLRESLSRQEEGRVQIKTGVNRDTGGFTLVELLVGILVSSWVVLAAVGLYVNGVQQREYQAAGNLLQENERYLREILTRSVHQAGFENWQEGGILRSRQSTSADGVPAEVTDLLAFNNAGLDTEPPWGVFNGSANMALQGQNNAKNRYLNNDVLMLRFQGMNDLKGAADGSLINCVGQGEPATTVASTWHTRPWVAFGVVGGANTGGEPELTCRYLSFSGQGAANWVARPLARGVEVFQLLLAVSKAEGGNSLRWLNPYQVARERLWTSVQAVRFGLVLRSPNRVYPFGSAYAIQSQLAGPLSPLGAEYTDASDEDPGTSFRPPNDGRLRRTLAFTVALRNPLNSEPG